MQPLVRVRFLVALVVLFGVLASVAAAFAAEKSRQAAEWEDLYRAQEALHQTAWPDDFRLVREVERCRPSATSVCLLTEQEPADAARTVAEVLAVQPRTGAPSTDGAAHHPLTGLVADHVVDVDVWEHRGVDDGARADRSAVIVRLHPAAG